MKFALLSDLHLEMASWDQPLPEADTLILAGDIFAPHRLHYGNQSWADDFFSQISKAYDHIIYIPGNHEHYHGDINDTPGALYSYLSKHNLAQDFTTADQQLFQLDNLNIFAATLWSDFLGNNPNCKQICKEQISDFRVIRNKDKLFTPNDAYSIHQQTLSLLKTINKETNIDLVITHHCPSFQSVHPKYSGQTINGAFASNLDDLILEISPKYWAHGHTHESFNYQIGETNILCNPRGYPRATKFENPNFNPNLTFEV